MNLYQVNNGYIGNDCVHVLVIAENEDIAKKLAREKFKEDSNGNENYYKNLEVYLIIEDTSKEFVSEIED